MTAHTTPRRMRRAFRSATIATAIVLAVVFVAIPLGLHSGRRPIWVPVGYGDSHPTRLHVLRTATPDAAAMIVEGYEWWIEIVPNWPNIVILGRVCVRYERSHLQSMSRPQVPWKDGSERELQWYLAQAGASEWLWRLSGDLLRMDAHDVRWHYPRHTLVSAAAVVTFWLLLIVIVNIVFKRIGHRESSRTC